MSYINKGLQERGFVTCFGEDRKEGNIVYQMTLGFDESACIAVFITSHYEANVRGHGLRRAEDNCKREFAYACNQKGSANLIPIGMEGRKGSPNN